MLMPPLSRWHRFDLLRQTETRTLTNGMRSGFPFASPERWNCTPAYALSVESGGEGRLQAWRALSRSSQRLFHSGYVKTPVLSVAFLWVLSVNFRKAHHRGHKEPQRATEKALRNQPSSRTNFSIITTHIHNLQKNIDNTSEWAIAENQARTLPHPGRSQMPEQP
jgi:hypothetical protein